MNIIKSLIKKFCTKEFIFYLIFGVLTTIVSLSVYYFCVLTFLNPNNAFQLQIANILSWILAVAFAYATNRKFVFESKDPNKLKELIKFVTARLLTLFLDMLVMFILVTLLHFNDKISKLISQVIITISNLSLIHISEPTRRS